MNPSHYFRAVRSCERLSGWRADALAMLLLVALHLAFFLKHYTGDYIFPWDFLGGYYSHAYGWYRDGSVFSPPGWFPWSSVGFPAALAVQSGAWYAPLALLDLFNVEYTLRVAAALQSLHVLFGAAGAYVLARSFGMRSAPAFVAALCFHLSVGFFSNQQHLDIIRAYAWLPWLLTALQPAVLARSRLFPCLAALALFQFLVSAYPGNIVTTAYACAVFCVLNFIALHDAGKRWRYVLALALMVFSGVSMALVKWWPFLVNLPLIETGGMPYSPDAAVPRFLLTIFFPYHDDQLLGSDITMRGAYVPMMVFIGLFFCRGTALHARVGAAFAFMGFLLGAVLYSVWQGELPFPGLGFSRFPWTDWRAIVHLGMILAALEGWLILFRYGFPLRRFIARFMAAIIVWLLAVWAAKIVGFPMADIRHALVNFVAIAGIALLFQSVARRGGLRRGLGGEHRFGGTRGAAGERWRSWYALAALGLLVAATVSEGWRYHRGSTLSWRLEWNTHQEILNYGAPVALAPELDGGFSVPQRPARRVLRDAEGRVLPLYRNNLYSRCWYAREFCVLGYDNLRLSLPHNALFDRLDQGAESERLLAYLQAPQQLLLRPQGSEFDIHAFPFGEAESLSLAEGASARTVSYSPEEVVYRIVAPQPLTAVENEMWWEGWSVILCNVDGCRDPQPSGHTQEYLRSWDVPAGAWTVTLRFQARGMLAAGVAFLLGVLVLALYAGWPFVRRR